ncbi:COG4315 family predicted lipoprotein [Actinomadura parmotrematis]|uniref:Lipoprotein n=1 Tax=Actinomadura parmotrematis TaxID=2864039 RepID=A0ABS7FYL4_9ACTN|nr:hypothetical protein [Actinomadura parmotrematis]MBW8485401.1 hypothetical protein [Actinomadura parmotrematis]
MGKALVAAALLIGAAGCSSTVDMDTPGKTLAPLPTSGPVTVNLGDTTGGRGLKDGAGRTLYLFAGDDGRPTCTGACAARWPPVLTEGAPRAGEGGVRAGLLGTVAAAGGGRQVAYAGHPLYRFARDAMPGAASGAMLQDFGAQWYVVDASGDAVRS